MIHEINMGRFDVPEEFIDVFVYVKETQLKNGKVRLDVLDFVWHKHHWEDELTEGTMWVQKPLVTKKLFSLYLDYMHPNPRDEMLVNMMVAHAKAHQINNLMEIAIDDPYWEGPEEDDRGLPW